MKKLLLITALASIMASCGGGLGEKKDQLLDKVGLTVTVPGETKITCYDSTKYTEARCEYTISNKKYRVEVKEIEEKRNSVAVMNYTKKRKYKIETKIDV